MLGWGWTSVEQHLSSISETLGSIPAPQKKEEDDLRLSFGRGVFSEHVLWTSCRGVLSRKGPVGNAGPHSRHAGSKESPLRCRLGSGPCHQPRPWGCCRCSRLRTTMSLCWVALLSELLLFLLKAPSDVNTSGISPLSIHFCLFLF